MRIVTDSDTLKTIVEAASFLNHEVVLMADDEGLKLNVVDIANAGLVNILAKPDAFKFYEVPEETKIAIDLTAMADMVGTAKKGTDVSIELDESAKTLKIQADKLHYSLRLLDPSVVRECPSIPDLEFTGNVVINSDDLSSAITATGKTASEVSIELDGEFFRITGLGNIHQVKLQIPIEELDSTVPEDPIRSLFSLDYLESVKKTINRAGSVLMELGNRYPMRLTMDVNGVSIRYLVAPRIEND